MTEGHSSLLIFGRSRPKISDNIYSATVQYHYTPDNLRLEQEKIGDGEGGAAMVGNRFNCYLNNGIIKGQNWLFQKGQNNPNPETGAGDLFVRLCPFWQLQLYNHIARLGATDFYPQIIEIIRNTDERNMNNKELQFNFMRNTCKVMNANMLEFFEKCGMLKPYDHDVSDYGGAVRLTITQEEIDEFKAEIQAHEYPQPASPVIYYISGNSVDAFKNKLDVVGTTGEGVSGTGSTRLVTAATWKNVVMFETYAGNELVKLTLPFTNYKDRTATTVFYPDGSPVSRRWPGTVNGHWFTGRGNAPWEVHDLTAEYPEKMAEFSSMRAWKEGTSELLNGVFASVSRRKLIVFSVPFV